MAVYRIDESRLYYYIDGDDAIGVNWSNIWGYNGHQNDMWTLLLRPTPDPGNVGLVDMSLEDSPGLTVITTKTYTYSEGSLVYSDTSPVTTLDNKVNNIVNEDVDISPDSSADRIIGSTNDDLSNIVTSNSAEIVANTAQVADMRDADALRLDNLGVAPNIGYTLALIDVEYIDAPLNQETKLEIITKEGFTTNGSISSITMRVGNHDMVYTSAKTDSTLFMGPGYDTLTLTDDPDLPGQQYWTLFRETDGELSAYNLVTGYKISLEGGYHGWTADQSPDYMNYGEIEAVILGDYYAGTTTVYNPGETLDYLGGVDRANYRNIDLRSDHELQSDSFNLAYFNFIRYTSDNVWAGEATIHNGTIHSTPGTQLVTGATSLPTIGTSRNGTHDLIVAEQQTVIAGNLRLYSDNVSSGAYNTFNDVLLGTSAVENYSYATNGSDWSDRVALYGFGGNDVLKGGAGYDYLFGGQSMYDQVQSTPVFGNLVTGNAGADYFGVGNTDSAGAVSGSLADKTITTTNATRTETYTTVFDRAYGTDVIMDWDAGTDTLVVLSNGVAVIGGLYGASLSNANTIDLRTYNAVATSDQGADGARGGVYSSWDSASDGTLASGVATLDYIFLHQQTRDEQSIFNETGEDFSVVNNGLIVARGLDGNDLLYASDGDNYLYGNAGVNTIILDSAESEGDVDRVYYDTRTGKQYVANFDSGTDTFYLSKNVIDAFDSTHASTKSWTVVDGTSGEDYNQAQAYDPNMVFIHGLSYKPLLSGLYGSGPYSNMQYLQVDFLSDTADTAAATVSYSTAAALTSIPFVGWALAIPFYVLGALFQTSQILSYDWDPLSLIGASLIPDYQKELLGDSETDQYVGNQTFLGAASHVNSSYALASNNLFTTNYVYVLDAKTSLATTNTTLASASSNGADNIKFMDFFHTVDDGFIPALELNPGVDSFADVTSLSFNFSAFSNYVARSASDYGVYAYFAVHSANETFVYLINSADNLITSDEAYLVAEIDGILASGDFQVYDSGDDIYNKYSDHPESGSPTLISGDAAVIHYIPTVTDVQDDIDNNNSWSTVPKETRTFDDTLRVTITLDKDIAADGSVTVKLYDGMAMAIESSTGLPVALVSGTITADSDSTNDSITITDPRALGQTIMRTDTNINFGVTEANPTPTLDPNNPPTGDDSLPLLSKANTFEYFDTKVSYYAVVESAISGGFIVKETSALSWTITANGPSDDTLYGGAGSDTLFLSATSAHLNTASDAQLVGIENITVKVGTGPILVVNTSLGLITDVTIADRGNDLVAGSYALTFSDSDADAETVPSSTWYAVVDSSGQVTSITKGSAGSGYSSSTSVSASWVYVGVTINLSNQLESARYYNYFNDTDHDNSKDSSESNFDGTDGILTSTDGYYVTLVTSDTDSGLDYREAAGFNVMGGAGADSITGSGGNDTIMGMDGADTLAGGTGGDTYIYSPGDLDAGEDLVEGATSGTDIIQTTDTLDLHTLEYNGVAGAALAGIEQLVLAGGKTATFTGSQLSGQNIYVTEKFASGSGNTTLHIDVVGTTAVDFSTLVFTPTATWDDFEDGYDIITIDGDSQNNAITGSILSDTITGGTGQDTIYGHSGNDIILYGTDAADEVHGGDGNDVIDDVSGANTSSSNNLLYGDAGADTIYGGGGNDTIIGGSEADSLYGEDGNDTFRFASNEELAGDATVLGGSGDDIIEFTAADTIADSDFSKANSIEHVTLTGSSSITLGAYATAAGIATVHTGTGTTNVTRTDTTATTLNASSLLNDTTLSVDDSQTTNFTVTNLTGNLSATSLAGTLNVDLNDNGSDDDISILLGTGYSTITGGHSSDSVTITGTETAVEQRIDLSGSDANHSISTGGGAQTIIAGTGVDTITTGAGNTLGTIMDRIEFHAGSATANISTSGSDSDIISRIATITDYNEDEIDFIGTDTVWANGSGSLFTTNAYGFVTFTSDVDTLAEKISAVRSLDTGYGDSRVVVFLHGADTYAYGSGLSATANDDQIVRIANETGLLQIVTGNSFVLKAAPVAGTPASAQSLLPTTTSWSGGSTNFVPTSFDPGGTTDTNTLITGLGGTNGFGTQYVSGDDSNQAAAVTFSWSDTTSLNMFGTLYSTLYMGTNGYITFGSGYSGYVPSGIAGYTRSPMIAAQFDDLYVGAGARNVTSGSGGGTSTGSSNMYYYGDATKMVFTWDNVGLYSNGVSNSQHSGSYDYGSAFQIILWKGTSVGDFGIEIRYEDVSLQYATATAGWTAGDTINYQLINPSGDSLYSAAFGSNIGVSGLWAWEVSGGSVTAPYYVPDIGIGTGIDVARVTFPNVTSTTPTVSGTDGSYGFVFEAPTNQTGGEYAILSTIDNPHWNLWKDRYVDNIATITLSAGGVSTAIDVQIINTGSDTVTRSGSTLSLSATSSDLNAASDADIETVTAISASSATSAVTIDLHNQNDGLIITGSSYADSIIGTTGNDTITGGSTDLLLDGRDGTDTLKLVASFNDTGNEQIVSIENILLDSVLSVTLDNQAEALNITGSSGNDTITSGSGADSISGGAGADSIYGGAGADSIYGGTGNDILGYTSGSELAGDATVDGGDGGDTLYITAADAGLADTQFSKVVSVESVQLTGASSITLASSAQAAGIGTVITGNSSTSVTSSMTVGLTVDASALPDGSTLSLNGSGAITVTNLKGDLDVSNTFTGNLSVTVATVDTLSMALGTGTDGTKTLTATALADTDVLTLTGADSASVSLVDGDLNATGYTGALTVTATTGSNVITTGSGNDTLTGGSGIDSLNGGAGNDVFLIASASDHSAGEAIVGGSGVDTIRFTANSGTLSLSASVTDSDSIVYAEISDASGLTTGTSAVNLSADLLAVNIDASITGNDGANILTGNADANNTIVGNAGNDTIHGGAQADSIVGGIGADSLSGGAGNDTFAYVTTSDSTSGAMDVITDFSFENDAFNLDAVDGAGDVGYCTTAFASLSALTTFATSNLDAQTSNDDLEVFVGLVSSDGAYVLIDSGDLGDGSYEQIIHLPGLTSLAGLDLTDFAGSGQQLYQVVPYDLIVTSIADNATTYTSSPYLIAIDDALASGGATSYDDPSSALSTVYGLIIIDDMGGAVDDRGAVLAAIDAATDDTSYRSKNTFFLIDGNGSSTMGDDGALYYWDDGSSGTPQDSEVTLLGYFDGLSGPVASNIAWI